MDIRRLLNVVSVLLPCFNLSIEASLNILSGRRTIRCVKTPGLAGRLNLVGNGRTNFSLKIKQTASPPTFQLCLRTQALPSRLAAEMLSSLLGG